MKATLVRTAAALALLFCAALLWWRLATGAFGMGDILLALAIAGCCIVLSRQKP